jgi:hypothetical protein
MNSMSKRPPLASFRSHGDLAAFAVEHGAHVGDVGERLGVVARFGEGGADDGFDASAQCWRACDHAGAGEG